ncbi:hypothetical protein [Thermogladius sp.]|uniref:hypothetical protein n=1 Tax=Thermogladius sp. TaxID=2023064 RepID=UPI003D0CEBD3
MRERVVVLLVALFAGLAAFIIHMPPEVSVALFGRQLIQAPFYDDFYQSVYNGVYASSCSGGENWINAQVMRAVCEGVPVFPVPYSDYKLNQPPLYALIASSMIYLSNAVGYKPGTPQAGAFFYILQSAIEASFLVAAALVYHGFTVELNAPIQRRAFSFFFPSMVAYSVYSLDTVSLFLLASSLYFASRGRLTYSALALAVGSSVNAFLFIPLSLLLYLNAVGGVKLSYPPIVAGFTPYIVLGVLTPSGLVAYFTYLVDNSLNNGLAVIFNYFAGRDGYGYWVGLYMTALFVLLALSGAVEEGGLSTYIASFTALAVVLNPSLPPQSLLFLTPLLYVFTLGTNELLLLYTADFLNTMIIPMWFKDSTLRYYANLYLGLNLPVYDQPWSLDSPVQWVVQARNVVLLALSLGVFPERIKRVIKVNKS